MINNIKSNIISNLILSILLCSVGNIFCQNVDFSSIYEAIESNDLKRIDQEFNSVILSEISDYDKATWYYYKAYHLSKTDNHNVAYEEALKSKKIFSKLDENRDVLDCNILIWEILRHQNNLQIDLSEILEEINGFATKTNDIDIVRKNYNIIAEGFLNINDRDKSLEYYKKSLDISRAQNDSLTMAYRYTNIGIIHQSLPPINLDSAIYYTEKAMPIIKKANAVNNLATVYNNLGRQNFLSKNYDKSLQYYLLADSIPLTANILKRKIIYKQGIAKTYLELQDYKKESIYLNQVIKLKDSINDTQQNIAISNIKEQFDNEKLRADNLEQENELLEEQSQKRQITIGLTATLFLGSIIAFLVYRNTKRKQRIAEQDRELQIQKTEKVLKEKEIETINAMVSGQEKERLRLAGELHDNLGSTLATVRMQVENLERNLDKVEDPKELLQKTHSLVNEAYDKVRSISHERNSGVMAKDGLLPAVQKLARTVSNANSLTVDVQDFGLENRIANELEITIFRIIQELVTNIVKHAHASEASISLTQHDNELNIMVEDNGKGFKAGKLQDKNGMGLGSIERRIEHLEGTMEVDSALGRGTSVSIDIPL